MNCYKITINVNIIIGIKNLDLVHLRKYKLVWFNLKKYYSFIQKKST